MTHAAATVAKTPGASRARCPPVKPPAEAATTKTIPQRPARSGVSHALVSACAAAANPRIAPEAMREVVRAGGSEFTRTNWRAEAATSRKSGMARTCACRSAKVRLQNGYSLMVSLMTREVAQK